MTVETTTYFTAWQNANGVNKNWVYNFSILDDNAVVIHVRDTASPEVITEYRSNFTRTEIDSNNGIIIYPVAGSALANTKQVRIIRNVPYTQETQIGTEGAFNPEIHERALDKLTQIVQQLYGAVSRSLRRPLGSTFTELPEDIANKTLAFDGAGNPIAGPSVPDIASAQTYALQAIEAATTLEGLLNVPAIEELDVSAGVTVITSAEAAAAAAIAAVAPAASYAALVATNVPASTAYISAATPAGVLRWKRDATGTALTTADGAKWSPDGEVCAEHFGAIPGDPTVDSGAAINAALAYTRRVKLPVIGDYYTRQTIVGDNREIVGARGGLGYVTRIIGLSAYLPAASPIVTIGGSAVFQGLNVKYDTLTGAEAKGERIGLALTGSTIHAQRGTRLDDFLIENCGTCIGCENGKTWAPFSITIGTGVIGSHSYGGVDLYISEAYGPTGSVIENLYINGNNTYDAQFGFRLGGGVVLAGWIGQLNIEHNRYKAAPVQFLNCAGTQVRSLHVEGVALLTDATDFVYIEGPQPTVGTMTVIHNGSYGINTGLVGFGETQQTSAAGNAQGDSYVFRADRVEVRGELTLADFPSDLPADNTWLSRLTGWRWFSRRNTAGAADVTLDIAQWAYEVYSPRGDDADEVSRYANPWFHSVRAGLKLGRIGNCGPISPVKSLLLDPHGLMLQAGVAMTGTTEFVTNGFSQRMQTGTVTLNRGLNGAEYLLDPAGGRTYQDIKFEGLLPPQLAESGGSVYVSVYFEIEAIAADAALNQVAVYLYNRSGTTRNNNTYKQIAANTASLLGVAAGKKKAVVVRALLNLSAWTWGTHPSIALMLQLNDATVVNVAPVKVSNVALAFGSVNPAYTVTAYPHNTIATA